MADQNGADFLETEKKRSFSISSSASTVYHVEKDDLFRPTRSLNIDARGIGLLPRPRGMNIPIYDAVDGSIAYVATRDRHCSGDSILSSPTSGNLVSMEYFFGPGRDPIVRLLKPYNDANAQNPDALEFRVKGKWTSRTCYFLTATGTAFEWSYSKRKEVDGERTNLLVLRTLNDPGEEKDSDTDKSNSKGRIVALLVRNKEMRSPGSSKCTAGNGGNLLIGENGLLLLEEPVIVATCLMMLKKEIDRRRVMQAAMIGAASGGGP